MTTHPTPEGRRCPECDGTGKSDNEHDCGECGYSHAAPCDLCGGTGCSTPTPAPEGGEANRCVFENADGQRCILTYGHKERHTPTLAATGGEEDDFARVVAKLDVVRQERVVKPLRQMARMYYGYDVKAFRASLYAETPSGLSLGEARTLLAEIRILRERATTAERRLATLDRVIEEELGLDAFAVATDGEPADFADHVRQQIVGWKDALTASQQEVARLREAIDCACNALTDSINVSGNDARTNNARVAKIRAALSTPQQEDPA